MEHEISHTDISFIKSDYSTRIEAGTSFPKQNIYFFSFFKIQEKKLENLIWNQYEKDLGVKKLGI